MEEDKTIVTDEVTTETNEGSEQTATSELSAETLLVQKNKLKDKNEALQAEIDALKAATPVKEVGGKVDNGLEKRLEALEFSKANPSLDAETVNTVFKLANAEGKSPKDMLENPMVKAYLKEKETEANNKAAMPTNSRSSLTGSEKPIGEMSRTEHEAWFNKRMNG